MDSEYTITIKTRAELEGAQAAAAALERQIGRAKAMGTAYEELEGKLAKAQAAIETFTQAQTQAANTEAQATARNTQAGQQYSKVQIDIADALAEHTVKAEEVTGAHDATAEAAKKNTGAHSKLNDVARGLSLAFPQLAQALRMLVNPYTALIAVAAAAAQAITSWVQRTNEAVQQQLLSEMLHEQLTSLTTLQTQFDRAAADFETGLKKIGTEGKNAAQGLVDLNRQIEANIALQDRLKDAQAALEKAKIRERVRKGEITPEQGLEQELAVDAAAEKRKADQELSAAQGKMERASYMVGVTEGEVQAARGELPSRDAVTQAQKRKIDQQGNLKDADKALDREQQPLRQRLQDLRDLQARRKQGWTSTFDMELLGEAASQGDLGVTDEVVAQVIEKTQHELDVLELNAKSQKKLAEEYDTKLTKLLKQQEEAQAKIDAATTRLETAKKQAAEAKQSFETLAKTLPEIAAANQQALQLAQQAQVADAKAKTDKAIEEAVKEKAEKGTPIPPEVQKLIDARAASALGSRPSPPPAPAASVVPRRTPPGTPTTGAEADAAQVRQDLIDAAAAQQAQWAAQSQTNATGVDQRAHDRTVRAAMLRDGAFDPVRQNAQMDTLGAQIVQALSGNTAVTTRSFQSILTAVQDQNRRLATLEGRLQTNGQ